MIEIFMIGDDRIKDDLELRMERLREDFHRTYGILLNGRLYIHPSKSLDNSVETR